MFLYLSKESPARSAQFVKSIKYDSEKIAKNMLSFRYANVLFAPCICQRDGVVSRHDEQQEECRKVRA